MSTTGPRRSPLGLVAGLAVAVPALVVALALSDVGGVLLCIAFGVPGVILAWRRPGQPIAWLLLLIAVGLTLGTVRTTASLEELTSGTMDRLGQITSWANGTGWTFVFGGILGLLLTFPSGHLPEGRWRPVSIVVIAIYLPIAAVLLFGPVINVTPTYALSGVDVPNPFVLPLLEGLGGESLGTTPIWTSLFVIQLVAVVAFLARFRRSIGLERLQYRWLAWAMIVVAIANAVWALVTIVVRPDSAILAMVIVAISYPAIPVAVVIAVLRYRLYDIDRLVSRTLGWGIATAAVVGVFVVAVLALQVVLSGVTQSGTLVVAASTLLAFAIFQPVRRRVQSFVDRRFDRPRLEAERILAGHGERLRHETDLERIEVGVLGTISETLRPSSATVWIRPVGSHGP